MSLIYDRQTNIFRIIETTRLCFLCLDFKGFRLAKFLLIEFQICNEIPSLEITICTGWNLASKKYLNIVSDTRFWTAITKWGTSSHTLEIERVLCTLIKTHLILDKMAAISQTTILNVFSWIKYVVFWIYFHWSLFLRVYFTLFHHLVR